MYITKTLYNKAFFIIACATIFVQYAYSADKQQIGRPRMPSPTPGKPWHELNNEIFVNIEDSSTLVKISYYKKQGPSCDGTYYNSGRTTSLGLSSGLKKVLAEKKSDLTSQINFTCERSQQTYVLSAQDGETFIVKPPCNDQVVIEKEGYGEVARFTLQAIKQRECLINRHPHFEIVIDEDGNRRIVKKES